MRALTHIIDDAVSAQAERSRKYPWQVTLHAAEQYRNRVDPGMAITAAWRLLERCLPASELLPEATRYGQSRWLLPGGDAVAVCKPDPKLRVRVAVTILGVNEMLEPAAEREVVEAYERLSAPELPRPVVHVAPIRRKASDAPRAEASLSPSESSVVSTAPPASSPREMVSRAHLDEIQRQLDAMAARYNGARRTYESLLSDHVALKKRHANVIVQNSVAIASAKADTEKWKERAIAAEVAIQRTSASATEAALKREERARHHADCMEKQDRETRSLLRIAVTALRDGDCARGLAALESARPGITGDHFCYPERFTKAERKAATLAAKGGAGQGDAIEPEQSPLRPFWEYDQEDAPADVRALPRPDVENAQANDGGLPNA